MPRRDGTGPEGRGPLTGKRDGFCTGYDSPGFSGVPVGIQRGRNVSFGFGSGAGYGWRKAAGGRMQMRRNRNRYIFDVVHPPAVISTADKLAALDEQIQYHENALRAIRQEKKDSEAQDTTS